MARGWAAGWGVPELDGPVEVAEVERAGGGVLVADLLAQVVLAGGHERREVGREPAQRLDCATFGRRQARHPELDRLLFGRWHLERRVERGEQQGVAVAAGSDLGAEAEGEHHVVVGHVVEGVARVETGGFVEEPEGGGRCGVVAVRGDSGVGASGQADEDEDQEAPHRVRRRPHRLRQRAASRTRRPTAGSASHGAEAATPRARRFAASSLMPAATPAHPVRDDLPQMASHLDSDSRVTARSACGITSVSISSSSIE